MTLRPTAFALAGVAAFGLAACDSADGPAAAPETATGLFDASAFADADGLIVTSNRANTLGKDAAIRYRNADPLTRKSIFFRERGYDVASFESGLFYEEQEEFFGTFDLMEGGRVARFARNGTQLAVNDDFVSPKGLSAGFGLIFVADVGQSGGAILDDEMLQPVLGNHNEPGAPNWDFHPDEFNGIVFGAGVDGFVNVYAGPGDPVDRFQVRDVNGNAAVNNHGITFDATTNTLIVSDVGLAGNPDDGAINVLDYDPFGGGRIAFDEGFPTPGPNANTPIQARATFAGANTMLGNPVDIAGSESDLFVAEKANGGGRVMRFADVLTATGMNNVAPAAMDMVPNPESVDTIARESGGGGEGERVSPRTAPYGQWTK